jgi:hypothetical protein
LWLACRIYVLEPPRAITYRFNTETIFVQLFTVVPGYCQERGSPYMECSMLLLPSKVKPTTWDGLKMDLGIEEPLPTPVIELSTRKFTAESCSISMWNMSSIRSFDETPDNG